MQSRYLYGMGLRLLGTYQVKDDLAISPASVDVPYSELEDCAETQAQYGLLLALAPHVSFQLRASDPDVKVAGMKLWNSQWFLMLLSIIANHPVHFPIQSSGPASEIKQAKTFISNVHFGRSVFSEPRELTADEMQLAISLFPSFQSMLAVKRFTHACIVACNNHREPNASVRVAAIWSGIEALMGFDYELRFRLALSIAQVLETSHPARIQRFDEVKALYDQRSKCVHGTGLSDERQGVCYERSQRLLRELLIFFTERRSLMSAQELTELSLSSAGAT